MLPLDKLVDLPDEASDALAERRGILRGLDLVGETDCR